MEYQEEYTVSDSLAIAYHKIVVIFVVTYKPLKWLGILYFVLHDVLMLIYNVTIINKLYIYIAGIVCACLAYPNIHFLT